MVRFAANISMLFTEHPFMDRFAAAADAGFKAVECIYLYDQTPEALEAALTRNGLTMALMNTPHGDWAAGERGFAALEGRHEEFISAITQVPEIAEATGCRKFHVMPGLCEPTDAALARYHRSLRHAADVFTPLELEVLIEPINRRDIPGFMLADFALAAETIGTLGLDAIRLQFDVYHRQILHGDIVRGLEALMPMIGHVQIADVPERGAPGTGEINYTTVFATLDALGYDGWVGCEYRPSGPTTEALGWRERYG
ncbi:MAG: TIM barrel protein [Pseudomonadota bacterium]